MIWLCFLADRAERKRATGASISGRVGSLMFFKGALDLAGNEAGAEAN
jgi:hypothetical protein